jgi:hypothetical protein
MVSRNPLEVDSTQIPVIENTSMHTIPVKESPEHKTVVRINHAGHEEQEVDNGIYLLGTLCRIPLEFLLDSGSCATIISTDVYSRISPSVRPNVRPCEVELHGVDGSVLPAIGRAQMRIEIDGVNFWQEIIVGDLAPGTDSILGHDFLMKYGLLIDYGKQRILYGNKSLPCRIGGEANMVCRVTIKKETVVPAMSAVWTEVEISEVDRLSKIGLVEPRQDLMAEVHVTMTPAIMATGSQKLCVNIVNPSDEAVTLRTGVNMGTCQSVYEENFHAQLIRSVQISPTPLDSSEPAKASIPGHLQELWERSSKHLTKQQSTELAALLIQYQDVFAKNSMDLGRTNRVKHVINTGGATPIKQAPRRQPIWKRDIEREEIKTLLDRGVIEPSFSPWASNIILVRKKDDSWRFVVDYRAVNAVTVPDAYPLPNIQEILDWVGGNQWYSVMDLDSGFWQIEMDEASKQKTAFASSMGLHQFKSMAQGLSGAPGTFSRLMTNVLGDMTYHSCALFMDDIVVPGKSFRESLDRLGEVFSRLLNSGLKLKPSKTHLFQKTAKFLGHIVSEEGIGTDPEKIIAVQKWPVPKSVKEVRSFLGLCGYYRRFVKDFGKIAKSLHNLTGKYQRFCWTEDCQKAFDTLKITLTKAPVMAYPVLGRQFVLDVDASGHAVGAVLSQIQEDDTERVISYMSKTFNKHEQNYCASRRELLGVFEALKHFNCYLYGQKILCRTDNSAVSWMKTLKNPKGQMARWLQEMEHYQMEVIHRPGTQHQNADSLSRIPCANSENPCKVCIKYSPDETESEDEDTIQETVPRNSVTSIDSSELLHYEEIAKLKTQKIMAVRAVRVLAKEPVLRKAHKKWTRVVTRQQTSPVLVRPTLAWLQGWSPEELHLKQVEDPHIGSLLADLEEGKDRPEWQVVSSKSAAFKTLWRQWDRLKVINGLLFRKWIEEEGQVKWQLLVPTSLQQEVLKLCHDVPSAAHLGTQKTLGKVKCNFYWPGMANSVQLYCRKCDKCAARKPPLKKVRAPLQQYLVGEPFERVALDILGPLPETAQGNKFVLCIGDYFSKWTIAIALPNQEAETVAKALVEHFVCVFGTPRILHSDKGSNFESEIFRKMCRLLDIDKTRTTSLRPQSDGMVERFNRTLGAMLTVFCEGNQKAWDLYLPYLLMAYRSSIHASTGQTPFKMIFGREIRLPHAAVIPIPVMEQEEPDSEDYIQDLQQILRETHEEARNALKTSAKRQKTNYDHRTSLRKMESGQPVWLFNPIRKKGVCSKLTSSWKGPFLILERIDDVCYRIQTGAKKIPTIIHVDRLKPYEGPEKPKWFKKALDSWCKQDSKSTC